MTFSEFLTLENQTVPIKIQTSRRMKRITLSVIPQDCCVVKFHPSVPEKQWKEFLLNNKIWILTQFNKKTNNVLLPNPQFENGEKILFKGSYLTLKISSNVSECRINEKNELLIPDVERKIDALNLFYFHQAVDELKKYYNKYRELCSSIKKFRLRSMVSRWGSCSSNFSISINWRLILAPEEIFEYVFLHEVSHLKNMSHGKAFWQSLEFLLPDLEKRKKWLKKHSSFLMNYPEPIRSANYSSTINLKNEKI